MTNNPRDVTQPEVTKIREEIKRTRQELGDTVEALAHKVDVPSRAKEKATEVLDTTKAKAAVAKDAVKAKAAEVTEQAQHGIEKLPQPAARRIEWIIAAIRQRPGAFIAGVVVSIMLLRRVVRRGR